MSSFRANILGSGNVAASAEPKFKHQAKAEKQALPAASLDAVLPNAAPTPKTEGPATSLQATTQGANFRLRAGRIDTSAPTTRPNFGVRAGRIDDASSVASPKFGLRTGRIDDPSPVTGPKFGVRSGRLEDPSPVLGLRAGRIPNDLATSGTAVSPKRVETRQPGRVEFLSHRDGRIETPEAAASASPAGIEANAAQPQKTAAVEAPAAQPQKAAAPAQTAATPEAPAAQPQKSAGRARRWFSAFQSVVWSAPRKFFRGLLTASK